MSTSTEIATNEAQAIASLDHLANLSIVVPVGPGEEAWRELLEDFALLPAETELLLIATTNKPEDLQDLLKKWDLCCHVYWKTTSPGRASQMNHGAALAANEYVWFLHADSRLSASTLGSLNGQLGQNLDTLMYFELEFRNDGPTLTKWNARGARWRSRVLGLPFGDQGFCLWKATFHRLGGFDEDAEFGEDHLFVWKAKQQGIPLKSMDASISTSARKYSRDGWLRTTLRHQWLTGRQALPQWWKQLRRKK